MTDEEQIVDAITEACGQPSHYVSTPVIECELEETFFSIQEKVRQKCFF